MIELLQGWEGEIISNQNVCMIMDALMGFLALAILKVVSPSRYLPRTMFAEDAEAEKFTTGKNGDVHTLPCQRSAAEHSTTAQSPAKQSNTKASEP